MQDQNVLVQDYQKDVIPYLIPGLSKDVTKSSTSGPNYFEIELGSDFASGTRYHTENTSFIHFTSLKVLHSIINENSIRLYSLNNVNDPNEINFFTEGLLSPEKATDLKSDTHIFSLCDIKVLNEGNILNLWRLYGHKGLGVGIEFEIRFSIQASQDWYTLGKVIYEKPSLEIFLEKHAAFKELHNVDIDLTNLLRVPASFHKSHYYKVEEEVRLMYFKKKSNKYATSSDEKYNKFKWDFNNQNEPITYHTVELGNWIKIKRIQIGFGHSKESFHKIENHLKSLYASKSRKYHQNLHNNPDSTPTPDKEIQSPIIEHSPLINMYR